MRPFFVLLLCMAACRTALADPGAATWEDMISAGIALRDAGDIDRSLGVLSEVEQSAPDPATRLRAEGELGATLLQAHRYRDAEAPLRAACAASHGAAHAQYANDLGNLLVASHRTSDATPLYEEAEVEAVADPSLQMTIELNHASILPRAERLSQLNSLSKKLDGLPDKVLESRLRLNLGHQATTLGQPALALAYYNLDRALHLSTTHGNLRGEIESLDALSQLYEDQNRNLESETLVRRALGRTEATRSHLLSDLRIALYWRLARLELAEGRRDVAIVALQRAVEEIEAVRQDIPIDYEDGRSSFTATLSPIYLGLADLLLRDETNRGSPQADRLVAVIQLLEQFNQAEMQDYLGDRCTVEELQGGGGAPTEGIAYLYPVLLDDRVELLLQTTHGVVRGVTPVDSTEFQATVHRFAERLRNDDAYEPDAHRLYDVLFRPVSAELERQQIRTVVVVANGVLRLVPIGALLDSDDQFVVQHYALATVTGISMTNTSAPRSTHLEALVAGLSEPGPVIDKLESSAIGKDLATLDESSSRGLGPGTTRRGLSRALDVSALRSPDERAAAIRRALALPGVADEVNTVARTLGARELLNAQFTDAAFRKEAESGTYRIVHVASHGYFGGSADSSFILTYDDLLTLGDLEQVLQSDRYRNAPIELLTLSACETAEGNERSPLGISGAAMKARAKSVLGTLWPVDDAAAKSVMEAFYAKLGSTGTSKAEALREAQLVLIHDPATAHPFYWAPFVLIGNWL